MTITEQKLYSRNFQQKENDLILSLIDSYVLSRARTRAGLWIRLIVQFLPVNLIISILKSKIYR